MASFPSAADNPQKCKADYRFGADFFALPPCQLAYTTETARFEIELQKIVRWIVPGEPACPATGRDHDGSHVIQPILLAVAD